MKKAGSLFVFAIAVLLLVSLISLFHNSSAQMDATGEETLGSEFGVSPETIEKIPKTPEEIKSAYLKQEWGKIIVKIPVIGQIHTFATNNPLLFKIIFAEPYSFSLVFFCILFLWIIVALISNKFAKASKLINENLCWIAGIAMAILVAQTKVYSFLSNSVLTLIFSRETWWARLIVSVIALAVFIIVYFFGGTLSAYLKKYREKSKQEERISNVEQSAKEAQAFIKGAEEGTEIKKKSAP